MNIGILTLPLHTNYGGLLQAYALQTVLEKHGHAVRVIDMPYRESRRSLLGMVYVICKRLFFCYILRKKVIIFQELYNTLNFPVVSRNTARFVGKYINDYVVSDESMLRSNDFDAIVVGSDQVWRPLYQKRIEYAYLDFTENWSIKRIAYAASFGTSKWEYTPKQTICCGRLLGKFDAISVREKSGVELCKKHFFIDAKLVLDPTMLLTKQDYIKLIEASGVSCSNGTLLTYILGETDEKMKLIDYISQKKSLKVFRVNSKFEIKTAPLEERIQPLVEEWLRGFYDAEFIVTDSFHACIFSILFQKPFIVIGNKERGLARFESLLEMFDLTSRLVTDMDIDAVLAQDIDYCKVYQKLEILRNESMSFLNRSLA